MWVCVDNNNFLTFITLVCVCFFYLIFYFLSSCSNNFIEEKKLKKKRRRKQSEPQIIMSEDIFQINFKFTFYLEYSERTLRIKPRAKQIINKKNNFFLFQKKRKWRQTKMTRT